MLSAGIRPQYFLFTVSPRFARDDKGGILCSALSAETDFGDGVATEIFIYFIFYFIFHI